MRHCDHMKHDNFYRYKNCYRKGIRVWLPNSFQPRAHDNTHDRLEQHHILTITMHLKKKGKFAKINSELEYKIFLKKNIPYTKKFELVYTVHTLAP